MERPPERSKRLHNFTLPYLRWGQQRFLRCVNLPSHHLPSSSSSPSPDHAANRSVVAAVRPWNLRTRRAACSEPGDESPAKIEIGVRRGVVNGEEMEKDEKLKFSVSLMKKEIEEDFSNMIGKRLPRRPKKRPRTVQKKLNVSFLSENFMVWSEKIIKINCLLFFLFFVLGRRFFLDCGCQKK
ncbi:hypothetical protein YC2023_075329 [Brassica napus]